MVLKFPSQHLLVQCQQFYSKLIIQSQDTFKDIRATSLTHYLDLTHYSDSSFVDFEWANASWTGPLRWELEYPKPLNTAVPNVRIRKWKKKI